MIPRRLRLPPTRIEYLFKKGKRIGNDCFTIRFLPSFRQKTTGNRYCVVISATLEALAVKRNRLRRQIYETIRLNQGLVPAGLDVIIIGKKPLTKLAGRLISPNLLSLFKKIR